MEVKIGDFVKLDYDMYANGSLVQTTDEKKGKKLNSNNSNFNPVTIILGKNMILKALDDAIEKKTKDSISLKPEEAFGKKDKSLIRTFPKSVFDKNKMRAVVGITYDFNGMFGTVKAVTGGRVMVDFNNPLSGKDIKIDYEVKEVIKNLKEKIEFVLEYALKLPKNLYEIEIKDLNVIIKADEKLVPLKEQINQILNEFIFEFPDYKLEIKKK